MVPGDLARTWFRVTGMAELPEPIPLGAFVQYDSGERLAPQALLNAFAYVRRQQEAIIAVEPVRSLAEMTWQDRTPLLGYYNPLAERYELPDFLAHVLKAAQDPDRPYVICLDEMNLAVVEHYFADFLSAWESGEAITLHDHQDKVADLPRRLPIPSNLMVLGTVNMDETTHGFSPKVLDWAFTVELAHVDVPRRCPGRMRLIG